MGQNMREAWHVVEIYCALYIIRAIGSATEHSDMPSVLAFLLLNVLLVVAFSVLSFKGKRWASRLLSIHIFISVAASIKLIITAPEAFDIFAAYRMMIEAFLFVGAIKLWRIKELPTRFTDPPTEPSAHA